MPERYEFKIDKECKHSRRFASVKDECPIDTIYVKREFSNGKNNLFLTIDEE